MLNFPGFFFCFGHVKNKITPFDYFDTEAPSPPRRGSWSQTTNQPTQSTKKIITTQVPLRCRGSTTQSGSFFLNENPGGFCQRQKMRKRKGFGILWSRYLWGWYAMLTASHAVSAQSAKGSRLVRVYVFTGWAFTQEVSYSVYIEPTCATHNVSCVVAQHSFTGNSRAES